MYSIYIYVTDLGRQGSPLFYSRIISRLMSAGDQSPLSANITSINVSVGTGLGNNRFFRPLVSVPAVIGFITITGSLPCSYCMTRTPPDWLYNLYIGYIYMHMGVINTLIDTCQNRDFSSLIQILMMTCNRLIAPNNHYVINKNKTFFFFLSKIKRCCAIGLSGNASCSLT